MFSIDNILSESMVVDLSLDITSISDNLLTESFKYALVADSTGGTNYDYSNIINELELYGYRVLISKDAGNYLCNNLYYNILKYISDNDINTKMIFIHIPKIKNISDIYMLASVFNKILN